jgi:hypothetical protein
VNQTIAPAQFAVDPYKLRIVGTLLLSSIAFIEASHLARAGRPFTMGLGIALLTPIAEDIKQLAMSCFTSAGNYESVESLLTPEFVKQLEGIAPEAAKLLASGAYSVEKFFNVGETPVATQALGVASVAAAASVPALLSRLQQASAGQEVLVETASGATGRQFTVYLPGTEWWLPVGSSKAFDVTSDLAAFSKPGISAPERAAVQALSAKGFGTKPGDSVTVVGYSEGGIIGANLISSGALTHLGGAVSGLVAVASPISTAHLPADTKVITIDHVDDPVPGLDLAKNPTGHGWTTVKLDPAFLKTHELASYRESVGNLPAKEMAKLNSALAAMSGGQGSGNSQLSGFRAERVRG